MPIDIYIDSAKRMVFETLVGTVTADEILETWNKISEDRDFDPRYRQFSDFSGVTKFDVSPGFFRQYATSKPIFDKSSRRALVAPSDFVFGMIRLYLTHLENRSGEIRVFRDMAEARRWLGLDAGTD